MLQPVVPPVLYKYALASTALKVLENGTLRWSSPELYNDHAEFQRMPRFEPTVKEAIRAFPDVMLKAARGEIALDEARLAPAMRFILEFFRQQIANGIAIEKIIDSVQLQDMPDIDALHENNMRNGAEEFLGNAKILCLTARHDNEVMWGTYADSHKGIVLGFKNIPSMNSCFGEAIPITYTDEIPKVASGLDFILYKSDTNELGKKSRLAVCYTKKAAWSYEEEWRLLTSRQGSNGSLFCDIKFLDEELDSVILGCKVSDDVTDQIKELVPQRYPHVKLFKMISYRGELIMDPILL